MSYINKTTGGVFNFKAPQIDPDGAEVTESQFPVFEKQTVALSSNKGTATIGQTETVLNLGASALAAATTLTLDMSKAPAGAKVFVAAVEGSTAYDITVKVGTTTKATLTGTASTTNFFALLWDGADFYVM